MKKNILILTLSVALVHFAEAQNIFPTTGNAGIGTGTTPSSYGHGGTNSFMELRNTSTAQHAQSHLIFSSFTNAAQSSMGSVTWYNPNNNWSTSVALIAAMSESSKSLVGIKFMTSTLTRMYLSSNGNVGIGVGDEFSPPTARLEVKSATTNSSGLKFTNLTSASPSSTSNNKALSVDASGNVILVDAGGTSSWQTASVGTNNIINSNTGGVIIGTGITSIPAGYKLYVSEGILAEKAILAVKNTTNWADFVFEKDYKLPKIEDVEDFILKNKHLPEIPSAKEVVQNGINVAENQAKLLQKIEELTLYLIEQNKIIKQQEERLKKLENSK